ncbi:unnamed protein product [Coregonus sp. 'balchen']|nr:unnamed protein product [Coregonus sp. 'balchen']
MRKRTADRDSKKQKTAGDEADLAPVCCGGFKRGLLAVCVIYVSVPFMMRLFPDIIKHLVYSHRVRVPFFVNLSQPADLSLNHTVNMYLQSEQGISLGTQSLKVSGRRHRERIWNGTKILWELEFRLSFIFMAMEAQGFGDSTGEPTEVGLTTDTLYLYQWVKARSGSSLVVLWGHSLGTGVATNTAVKLMEQGIVVDGVIIEGAYTNIRQEGAHHPFGWFYWTFPGFEYFFLDTMAENNVIFPNDENLKRMRSRLLILHAEDDHIVPIHMAQQLYEIAQSAQNSENQVKMIPFAGALGYLHNGLYKDPRLPDIIREFVHTLAP